MVEACCRYQTKKGTTGRAQNIRVLTSVNTRPSNASSNIFGLAKFKVLVRDERDGRERQYRQQRRQELVTLKLATIESDLHNLGFEKFGTKDKLDIT